ncbi:MAG: HDOD domain-containing protein [Clostridiaceae bacterium]|nr:HDOD domain-containing protein [Clostridiaceae bacterium]MCI9483889.1 HDOD domain-containing protein [Clostridiaceae bacterium]NBI82170.1 HDOD domain-containing protein [Clostridiaceae bacterium]
MESKYIVRRPIKDREKKIIGYEIVYHGENMAYGSEEPGQNANDFAVADTVYSFLTQNAEKSLKGSLNFMTFNTTLLMKKAPRLFEKESLVIQIDDSVIIHPLAMHFVQQYKKEGYRIAVNEFQFAPRYLSLIGEIDYIKVNVASMPEMTLHNVVEIAHSMGKQCIATNITNEELYQRALGMEVDALEGPYVAEQLATKAHTSGYLQSSFFRLMVAVTRELPDVEEIEQIISVDATLTYGLLRIANSAYFAMRNRVTTIRQAVMTLGIGQLKQWVYLLSASGENNMVDAASEEFLKLSFMRASFCSELMNHAKGVPISKGDAYLMGMLSTLNYLIDAPLEEILAEIPLPDEIRAALLTREGRAGKLFSLVLSYERADWSAINELAEELGIPTNLLTSLYFSCADVVDATWQQITCQEPSQEGAEEPETTEV